MKTRITIAQLYEDAAEAFRSSGDLRPSHCDVRCYINELLDSYERDGFTVPHGYSQDKAHKAVLRLLRSHDYAAA